MNSLKFLFPLLFFTIASCGGSSGGGTTPQLPPTTNVPITSNNAGIATKIAWEASNSSADMTDLLGNTGFVSVTPGGVSKPQAGILKTASLESLIQKIPFGPDTFPCQLTGSITIEGELANPLTLSAGDIINVDADMCDDGLGERIDGLLAFTVNEFSGDLFSGAYLLTMSMNLTSFQVTTAEDVVTSMGDAMVSLDTRVAAAVSASVSGVSLSSATSTASATMRDYNTLQTLDLGMQPSPYTLNSQATLVSTELGGTVSYSTLETFLGFDTDYPHDGELLVMGENSSARLIVVDNVNVSIEIDNDNDGVVDETIDTTWAELSN